MTCALVDIKRTDTLKDRLHHDFSPRRQTHRPTGLSRTDKSDGRAQSSRPEHQKEPPHHTVYGLTGTKNFGAVTGRPPNPIFIRPPTSPDTPTACNPEMPDRDLTLDDARPRASGPGAGAGDRQAQIGRPENRRAQAPP
jgi:hypothetical protein